MPRGALSKATTQKPDNNRLPKQHLSGESQLYQKLINTAAIFAIDLTDGAFRKIIRLVVSMPLAYKASKPREEI